MLKLKIILGSTRPGRFSEKILPWVLEQVSKNKNFEVEVLDLRSYVLPFYDQPISPSQVKDGNYANPEAKRWAGKIAEADAFLMIAPEYNHGPSAVLKNALDSVYTEWNNKPVSFVSYGSAMGARAVEQLRLIAVELQMAPTRSAVHLLTRLVRDEAGNVVPAALAASEVSAAGMLEQLSWWGEALKAARQK